MIFVNGHGEIDRVPDLAVLTLGVVLSDADARAAMQRTSNSIRQVMDAVREQGVEDQNIRTTNLNLYRQPETAVFEASHFLTLRIKDVATAGDVLAAAVDAGANSTSGIQFGLADWAQHEDRALELAVADARRKAEVAARAFGLSLGDLGQVTIIDRPHFQAEFGPMRRPAPAAALPVEPGQLQVVATVQVSYHLRPTSEGER